MAHQNYTFKTLDPETPDGPLGEVTLYHSTYLHAYKYSPVEYENIVAAKEVLDHPERIFEGVRAFNDGGWCYTGRPSRWCIKEGVFVPFPDDLIFTVYINPGRAIYSWRAEKAAQNDKNSPDDWENRYQSLTWSRIS